MTAQETLNSSERLMDLIYALEHSNSPQRLESLSCHIVVASMADYRELKKIFLIPKSLSPNVIDRQEDRDNWVESQLSDLGKFKDLDLDDISLLTVVVPGSKPEKPNRFSTRNKLRVRFISALYHIWRDRLSKEEINDQIELIKKFGVEWTETEEEKFITPSLSCHGNQELSQKAISQLKANKAYEEGLVVIYGPGGIGKTHFLRRLAGRYTHRSLNDLTQGIPVFTILPTLLHRDVLENYLSHKDEGFRGLTLYQIKVLIQHGIIIPFLDAFDELARGTVRDGCKEFLKALSSTMRLGASGLLTSRDYYLHIDPLIPQTLGESQVAQVVMGFFNKQGRKEFIRKKTKLPEPAVNAWSASLEEQVNTIFDTLNEKDVNGLVGHPLFMDALCYFISATPKGEAIKAAESFKFQTPNVFGEIVEKILDREYQKAKEGWNKQFGDKLVGDWSLPPFSVDEQLDVLRYLTLKVAEIGSHRTEQQYGREWIHGLFDFNNQLVELDSRKLALWKIIEEGKVFSEIEISPSVPQEETSELRRQVQMEVTGFYLQHTLAYTEPNAPKGLIFSTRHRTYFEYFLARSLVDEIYLALTSGDVSAQNSVISWSEKYHIFDNFSSCLDFLLWDSRIEKEGIKRLREMFDSNSYVDETTASYYLSLALALLMRRTTSNNISSSLSSLSFTPKQGFQLELLPTWLPSIRGVEISDTDFPCIAIYDAEVSSLKLNNCEFEELSFSGKCTVKDIELNSVPCQRLHLSGTITFQKCVLDLRNLEFSGLVIDSGASVYFDDCELSSELLKAIDDKSASVRKQNCEEIPTSDEDSQLESLSKGTRFIHKLMSLVRKDRRDTYGVYIYKLRGRTGVDVNFNKVLDCLRNQGFISNTNEEMITLTDKAEKIMFDGKRRPGCLRYEDVEKEWKGIVQEIDIMLE
jgi:hypothetical protein